MDEEKQSPTYKVQGLPVDRTITVTLKHNKSDAKQKLTMKLPEFIYFTPLADLERVWRYCFKVAYENESAMQELDEYLPALVQDAKTTWRQAGLKYKRGWRDPDKCPTKAEMKATKKANDELAEALLKASKCYEKYEKALTLYNRVKARIQRRF